MRVLMFSNWVPPVVSGSSYYASSLARSLADRGHEIVLVTLDWGAEYAPSADLPFPVYRLPVFKIPKLSIFYNLGLMGFAFTPGNHRRLQALVRRYAVEILHHVNHIFDTTFLTVGVARSAGIPVVGSITTPIQHQNPFKQLFMTLADRMTVGHFGVKRWDGIVCCDRADYDYVTEVYGRQVQVRCARIPLGTRRESMRLYEDRSLARAPRPQILMTGHIHPFRNPVQLIRAMPLVLKAVPEARVILAGRVDLKEPVEVARTLGLTEDQVQFLGQTPHDETVRLMKTSHVFAMWATAPYRSLGTASIEAMLCETPAISNAPEDLFGEGKLRNGENIVLVDTANPQAVADAIIRLLKDEGLRQRIGAAGRRFVLEHLSWESIAAQMEKFYERILDRQGLRVPKGEPVHIQG